MELKEPVPFFLKLCQTLYRDINVSGTKGVSMETNETPLNLPLTII